MTAPRASAPDPKNYRVMRRVEHNGWVLLEVYYPDCTNFEGRKLLLFKGEVPTGSLDPHFSRAGGPVARFRPDRTGMTLAHKLMGLA